MLSILLEGTSDVPIPFRKMFGRVQKREMSARKMTLDV